MNARTDNPDITNLLRSPLSRGAAALIVSAGAALTSVVAYFDPSANSFFPVCPLYRMTGFACPGCGMTRGFHALLHGDLASAVHYNALIPLWAFVFGYLAISLVLFAVRGRGLPMGIFMSPAALWIFLGILLLFGVLRNLPFYPFDLLFP